MSIADLIRPRWKHSNPEIRLQAVKKMDKTAKDRLEKIAANDPDSNVRIEAINKISDEKVLGNLHDLAFGQSDSPAAEAAKARLNSIYCENILQADDKQIQVLNLEKINDEKVLAELACKVEDIDIRLAIVKRIYSPELLCDITSSNCGLKTGMAIVDRLTEAEEIKQISQKASNKKLKKYAQNKLDAIIEELNKPSPEQIKKSRLEELCQEIETYNMPGNLSETEKFLSGIINKWQALSPDDNDLITRFNTAKKNIEQELDQVRKVEQVTKNLGSICEKAEKLIEFPAEDAETRMQELETDWEKQEKDIVSKAVRTGFEQRFKSAGEIFRKNRENQAREAEVLQEKIDSLNSLCRQAQELAGIDDPVGSEEKMNLLKDQWDKAFFEHVETQKLLTIFNNSVNLFIEKKDKFKENQKQEQEAQEKQLIKLCEIAEAAVDNEDRFGLDQKVRDAQQEWKETGGLVPDLKESLYPRFKDACDKFFIKQREYWEHLEWERWANYNQKEELCKVVEHLYNQEQIQGIAKITREAQKKWKEIGPVAKDKSDEIWNRFNLACDKIFKKCLDRKKELYEQLTGIAVTPDQDQAQEPDSNINSSINWTETSGKIKEIQSEWNALGSLPLALEKDLRQDFQALCNTFFEKRREFFRLRDEDRLENLKIKTDLCKQAQEMSLSEDWNSTASKYKKLQRQWKETGPVPKSEGDELWQEFRQACNSFFDRMKEQEPENLKLKQELCVQVENLLEKEVEESEIEKISRELIDLQKQWKTIGPVPFDQAEEIWQRFHKPCDEFFSKRKEYLKQRESDQEQNEKLKEELIVQAEALSDSKEWKETGEKLKEIQKAWKEIGPCAHKVEQDLWQRFRSACDLFFTSRKDYFDKLENDRMKNLEEKEKLCFSLEALARLVIPERTLDTVPSAEQLSIALEYKNEIVVPGNNKATWDRAIQKVRDIQKQWKNIGPVPKEKDEELWKRFRSAGDIFFTSPVSAAPQEKKQGEKQEDNS